MTSDFDGRQYRTNGIPGDRQVWGLCVSAGSSQKHWLGVSNGSPAPTASGTGYSVPFCGKAAANNGQKVRAANGFLTNWIAWSVEEREARPISFRRFGALRLPNTGVAQGAKLLFRAKPEDR